MAHLHRRFDELGMSNLPPRRAVLPERRAFLLSTSYLTTLRQKLGAFPLSLKVLPSNDRLYRPSLLFDWAGVEAPTGETTSLQSRPVVLFQEFTFFSGRFAIG